MPFEETDFEQECEATHMAMKRLRAAGGRLVGGYTLCATTDLQNGAFIVRHKGLKLARNRARELRKEIPGAKILAEGQVLFVGQKVILINSRGKPVAVTRFINKVLVKRYKKLAFMKKFKWATEEEVKQLLSGSSADGNGSGADGDTDSQVGLDELHTSAEEQELLRAELASDPDLGPFLAMDVREALNAQVAALDSINWKKQAEAERSRQEAIAEEAQALVAMQPNGHREDPELAQRLATFASHAALGPSIVAEVGSSLAPDTQVLVGMAERQNGAELNELHAVSAQFILSTFEAAEQLPDSQRPAFVQERMARLLEEHKATQTYSTVYESLHGGAKDL